MVLYWKRFDVSHTLLLMSCFYVSGTILTGLPRKTDWVLEQWQEIKSRSRFDIPTLLPSISHLINKSIKIVKLNLTLLYYSVVIRIQIFLPQKRKQQFFLRPGMDFLPSHPKLVNKQQEVKQEDSSEISLGY